MRGVDKMNALDLMMSDINRKYKEDLIGMGVGRIYVDKIQFSSPRVNYITYGGIPVGKATEFFGGEGGGKTTSALDIAAQAQRKAKKEYEEEVEDRSAKLAVLIEKNNKSDKKYVEKLQIELDALIKRGVKKVVYIDAENTLDEDWAEMLGVDVSQLILCRPQTQTAEQVLQMMLDLIKTDCVELMVLDSIPMLIPQQLYEGSMEDKSFCGVAGPMSVFSMRVAPLISKHRVALIMVNQMRDDIENKYNIYKTPGGRALKHLFALRLYFRKGSLIDETNGELKNSATEPFGNLVEVTIAKTKVSKPDRRLGYYTLKYNEGIDVLADTVDLAVKYGIIRQSGSYYYLLDVTTGEVIVDADSKELNFQGRAKLLDFLREDDYTFEEVRLAVEKQAIA